MPATEPRHTPEKLARLGAEVFERRVRPMLRPEDDGMFVALDDPLDKKPWGLRQFTVDDLDGNRFYFQHD